RTTRPPDDLPVTSNVTLRVCTWATGKSQPQPRSRASASPSALPPGRIVTCPDVSHRLRQEPPTCRSWRVALSITRFQRWFDGAGGVGAEGVAAPGSSTPGGQGVVWAATKAPAPAAPPNTPSPSVRLSH